MRADGTARRPSPSALALRATEPRGAPPAPRQGRFGAPKKKLRRWPACAPSDRPGDGWSDDPADPAYTSGSGGRTASATRRCAGPTGIRPGRGARLEPPSAGARAGQRDLPARLAAPRHPTAGCIAFARADLAWVLARWSRRSRVVVRYPTATASRRPRSRCGRGWRRRRWRPRSRRSCPSRGREAVVGRHAAQQREVRHGVVLDRRDRHQAEGRQIVAAAGGEEASKLSGSTPAFWARGRC